VVKEENGSVLDGIIPKEEVLSGNGMLATLLEKKPLENHLVNGVGGGCKPEKDIQITDRGLELVPNNHVDFKKMNGGSTTESSPMHGVKRPASTNLEGVEPAAKTAMVEMSATTNGVNGPTEKVLLNTVPPKQVMAVSQQPVQVIAATGQQRQRIIINASGQQTVVQAAAAAVQVAVSSAMPVSSAAANRNLIILQPNQSKVTTPGQPQTVVIQQPQVPRTLVTNANGQIVVSQAQMTNGQLTARLNGSDGSNVTPAAAVQVPRVVVAQQLPAQQHQQQISPSLSSLAPSNTLNPSPSPVVPSTTAAAATPSQPSSISSSSIPPNAESPNTPTTPTSVQPSSNSATTTTPSSTTSSATSPTTSATGASVPKPNPQSPFLCEWQGCMKAFKLPKEVENHAIKTHCPLGQDDIPCLWLRCDGMRRKRFSLMTHIQDRHCHPQVRIHIHLILS
jgi:AT-rich interactive domain-containing protein 2